MPFANVRHLLKSRTDKQKADVNCPAARPQQVLIKVAVDPQRVWAIYLGGYSLTEGRAQVTQSWEKSQY
jgi:hypothetical protein